MWIPPGLTLSKNLKMSWYQATRKKEAAPILPGTWLPPVMKVAKNLNVSWNQPTRKMDASPIFLTWLPPVVKASSSEVEHGNNTVAESHQIPSRAVERQITVQTEEQDLGRWNFNLSCRTRRWALIYDDNDVVLLEARRKNDKIPALNMGLSNRFLGKDSNSVGQLSTAQVIKVTSS